MTPDPEDLRSVLRAARPSGKDDDDAQIRAAREAADPAMLAELAEERVFDDAVARDLRSNEPPADFEAQLITAMRAARAQPSLAVVPPSRLTRRSWLGWAAAASLAGGAGTWWWTAGRATRFDDLVDRLAKISKEGVTLSLMSMDRLEVGDWLSQAGAPRTASLPESLDVLPRKGCHLYDIDGRPVSLECFLLPGMRQLHLFTTATRGLRGAPGEAQPRIAAVGGLTAGSWTRDGKTMMLLSEESSATITDLLVGV
jgi:hypothetical protein